MSTGTIVLVVLGIAVLASVFIIGFLVGKKNGERMAKAAQSLKDTIQKM